MASIIPLNKTGRRMRRPRHTFNLEYRPFEIQPFMIAPVIPGETMKTLLIQQRVVSDPIDNPLIGWWHGVYFFYVKLRDLDGRDDFQAMFVDEDKDLSSYNEAASTVYNHAAGNPNWLKLCTKRVVEEYFRDEGTAWDAHTSNGLPLAMCNNQGWWQSALDSTAYGTEDFNIDTDASSTIEASEVEDALRKWQMLKMNQLTDMSYEDYLRTYGISVPKDVSHMPELIRYVEEWTYPTNTIDASTGSPSSAVSWSIRESANKDRFFKEPGFLIGLTCTRPKVYLKDLDGNAADVMTTAYNWLPAVLSDDPYTSLKKLAQTDAPLGTQADVNGYWIDIKDLLIHGDQFRNYANTATDKNIVDLPSTDLTNKKYVATTDIDNLFVTKTAGTGQMKSDGVVNLGILGRLMDTTPGVPVAS